MRCIDEVPAGELRGKRVLLRAGLDLPLNEKGEVADTFRLKQSVATMLYLVKSGAKVIVVAKIGKDPDESMAPVAAAMKKFFPVFFVPALSGPIVQEAIAVMKDGDIVLLENLQQDAREKEGSDTFGKELASLADIYVNDAFPSIHRSSTTMVNITKFLPSYAGLLVREEVKQIDEAREPQSPSLAMLGGSKFETKAPLIQLLLEKYDHVFITGALANDVFKAHGLQVGRSLLSKELPSLKILAHPHFLAPIDVTAEKNDGQAKTKKPDAVEADEKIVDIGPETVAMLASIIREAKFILWNGPTGIYEKGYNAYTKQLAELAAKSAAKVVVGGGDTVAAIEHAGVHMGEHTFLSTGGGAMMEYLLKGTLPGIEALK